MALGLWIARSVAAAILGLVVFVSFLSFMLVDHVTSKLLDARLYTQALDENDTYNRIYDEVLMDDQVRDSTRNVMGNVRVVTHEEIVGLARQIVPPEYIEAQVEDNIQRTTSYLREEVATLDLQLDLGPPLSAVKPVLFAEIDQRIDQLETVGPDPDRSLQEQVAQLRNVTEAGLLSLASGEMPEAVPSVRLIPEPFRADLFDVAFPNLLAQRGLDPRARAGLESRTQELRSEFISGDTKQFLKIAARAALTPLIDDAIARLRLNLDSQDRLDLIAASARNKTGTSEARMRADIEEYRDQFSQARSWSTTWALVIGIGATVLMVLIYLPSLTNMLRWPGLTLLLTGLVLYIVGKVLENTLPERLNDLMESTTAGMSGIPPSAVELVNDVLRSLVNNLVEGIATPMLLLIIVGAVLFGASFLVFLLRRYIPGIR